ncbi:MAG: hypothetical protein JO061_18620 [Acidobacteriaceae bacterium]|nr:hypothetical protein [Acidobacteriaceae bacterium]
MNVRKASDNDPPRCSFCRKADVKLISNPSDYPRAYICDECIAVCADILDDDNADSQAAEQEVPPENTPHPLLNHPLASELMEAIEHWIREQSLGNDAATALCDVHDIASRMLAS